MLFGFKAKLAFRAYGEGWSANWTALAMQIEMQMVLLKCKDFSPTNN